MGGGCDLRGKDLHDTGIPKRVPWTGVLVLGVDHHIALLAIRVSAVDQVLPSTNIVCGVVDSCRLVEEERAIDKVHTLSFLISNLIVGVRISQSYEDMVLQLGEKVLRYSLS